MGGGNGQKAKTARERNMEKQKAAKGNSFSIFLSLHKPQIFLDPSVMMLIHLGFVHLFIYLGSQLEANKKAMNIQVCSPFASLGFNLFQSIMLYDGFFCLIYY